MYNLLKSNTFSSFKNGIIWFRDPEHIEIDILQDTVRRLFIEIATPNQILERNKIRILSTHDAPMDFCVP